ncbi:NHLP leader peptide family RiPP precursor [Sungkyunkwania multivorans]|uniref:NHLP leader peptide family RiPP n=1 Tax=Sungkyunkwania multivorans TaxID=1173618 RepID=A0ABW3D1T0_9FLAO
METTREQQLFETIVNEAWENETFKADLIENPVSAIEKLTGEKLNIPEGKKLVVRDQTDAATVYINIPAKPEMEDVELNEEQLEAVAGGCYNGPSIIDILKDLFRV